MGKVSGLYHHNTKDLSFLKISNGGNGENVLINCFLPANADLADLVPI